MKYWKFYLTALIIIALDQIVKLWVHFNMQPGTEGEIHLLGDWLKLHYTLNEGMAFGIKLGEAYGKMFLTLFRWIAMIGITYYIYYLVKNNHNQVYIWCITLIFAGAVGNVIDSTFYGVWIDDNASVYMPEEQPWLYPWFHGKVIDMFYVDIWQGYLPDSIPIFGGSYVFLWPIFNVADSSIFIGVSIILIFQKKFFPNPNQTQPNGNNTTTGA